MFQASLFPCLLHQVQRANSFQTLVSVDKCLPDFFLFESIEKNLQCEPSTKLLKPGDFRFFLLKNREIRSKHGRLYELKGVDILFGKGVDILDEKLRLANSL